jgi:DNA-binding HxlR family transcriptional regulator
MSTVQLGKITGKEAAARRRYDDACGTAHGLDLVGDRWSLLVMRELMLGPRRFGAVREGLPGISANVLTQKLEALEAAGVLVRRRLPPPASTQVYELTPWGYEAEPIFQVLGRWAARSPHHDPTLPLSAASVVLSMTTMIDREAARGLHARIGLRLGAESILVRLDDGVVAYARDDLAEVDLLLEAAPPVIAAALYGEQPLDGLEAAGALKLEGDRALAQRFTTLFRLPPKADPAA